MQQVENRLLLFTACTKRRSENRKVIMYHSLQGRKYASITELRSTFCGSTIPRHFVNRLSAISVRMFMWLSEGWLVLFSTLRVWKTRKVLLMQLIYLQTQAPIPDEVNQSMSENIQWSKGETLFIYLFIYLSAEMDKHYVVMWKSNKIKQNRTKSNWNTALRKLS